MAQTMINVYTTSHRRKARTELKRAGIKPYAPPKFGGLIAADRKPSEALYVHRLIGKAPRNGFARLYARTSKTQRRHAYSPGDKVLRRMEKADVPGVVTAVCGGGWYEVAFDLLGKRCLIRIDEHNIHPGIK